MTDAQFRRNVETLMLAAQELLADEIDHEVSVGISRYQVVLRRGKSVRRARFDSGDLVRGWFDVLAEGMSYDGTCEARVVTDEEMPAVVAGMRSGPHFVDEAILAWYFDDVARRAVYIAQVP